MTLANCYVFLQIMQEEIHFFNGEIANPNTNKAGMCLMQLVYNWQGRYFTSSWYTNDGVFQTVYYRLRLYFWN